MDFASTLSRRVTLTCCCAYDRAILLPMIVERAKKCLDFTSTLYIIHLGICSFYDGVPRNWEWWMLQMASLALMVVLGEPSITQNVVRGLRGPFAGPAMEPAC